MIDRARVMRRAWRKYREQNPVSPVDRELFGCFLLSSHVTESRGGKHWRKTVLHGPVDRSGVLELRLVA